MSKRFGRISTLTFTAAIIVVAALSGLPPRSTAGSLSTAILGMFPKQVGEFAYADMKSARKYSWFPQLRDQLLPSNFRKFEQFLSSAGVDPSTQVDEVAWSGTVLGKSSGEEIVGIALGAFDPGAAEARFKQQKLPVFDVKGYHLFAFGSGQSSTDLLFVFIDANTAAFGHRSALEKMIDVRAGTSDSLLKNDKIYPLIDEANGKGIIWAVLDQNYTHLAMTQLLPEASQFPQAETLISRMQAMTINIEADDGVDAQFQAVCSSPADANTLSAALQAGIMYRRYQEAQNNSALSSALDQVHVTPSGDRLKVEVPISQDQLLSLIKSKVFAVPM